jgi:hypothetical protein
VNASGEHILQGPDAGQLIGFLCSLGVLEAATRSLPEHSVGLGFRWRTVAFRPVVAIEPRVEREELTDALLRWIDHRCSSAELTQLGDDLPCDPELFNALARDLIHEGQPSELLAAFGVARASSSSLDDTAFRTMSGAGHQRFLKFAREISAQTTADHIARCLFATWTYEDPKPSLRFDAADDRRYALRADDPARGSSSAPIRTVRGANALAFEGLALLPVVPGPRSVSTTLVNRINRTVIVQWPLWERPLSRDAVASLLAHSWLDSRPGIAAIFQARRITVDKFRSFTPAVRVR